MASLYKAELTSGNKKIRIEIEQKPEGFYIYYFENDEDISFRDYLEDTLELAMLCAWEDYSVGREQWELVE